MDTSYVGIMLVVFLVLASLAVSVGYLYVDEEDMHAMAEVAALAGTQEIKKRMLEQLRVSPGTLKSVTDDTVQSAARTTAADSALGKHKESALMHALNSNTNQLTTSNDMTVGFWNISTQTYTAGAIPVNAMQVRIRRTAESETFGIGNIGNIVGVITGVQKFDYTPDAIAALPPRANASFALCTEACESRCSFPDICQFPEKEMVSDPWSRDSGSQEKDRFASAYRMHQQSTASPLSDLICMEPPPREICRKEILTSLDQKENALRDMESMMYNPNVDPSNKEYDRTSGRLLGWWVIAPVTDCPKTRQPVDFERSLVTRYALVRITRICAPSETGCQQNNTSFDSPAATCGNDKGLFIDRISCVNCSSSSLRAFPGLHPVLVK